MTCVAIVITMYCVFSLLVLRLERSKAREAIYLHTQYLHLAGPDRAVMLSEHAMVVCASWQVVSKHSE